MAGLTQKQENKMGNPPAILYWVVAALSVGQVVLQVSRDNWLSALLFATLAVVAVMKLPRGAKRWR